MKVLVPKRLVTAERWLGIVGDDKPPPSWYETILEANYKMSDSSATCNLETPLFYEEVKE